MNASALERAVARATGESRRTIRRYGFNLIPDEPHVAETASHLGLDCPGCGAGIVLHSADSVLPEFAECTRCDSEYPYAPNELYLANVPKEALAACA